MDDAALRAKIAKQRDSAKTYAQHNALPHAIVTEHGARGYAIYRGLYSSDDGVREAFFDLDSLPAGCPFPGGLAPAALVDRVFAPVANHIPQFVGALRERCKAVLALERTGGNKGEAGWFLLYFLDRGTKIPSDNGRYTRLAGRAPMKRPKLNAVARGAGFTLPESLRFFYNVHNGLGFASAHTMGVEALLSAKLLRPLAAAPDLLEIYCDSGGNRKSYPRGKDAIVDWDRSTREMVNEGSLWTLFERELIHYVLGDR